MTMMAKGVLTLKLNWLATEIKQIKNIFPGHVFKKWQESKVT